MQALVKTQKGVGFLALLDVEQPKPGPGEVLIEVKACGICGTDVHVLHDQFPYWPPVVLGHEFSGEVVELGPEAKYYKVGDRVVGEPHTQACGHCYLCRTGNVQICPTKRSPGWGINGAFTKYLKMPEKLLHRIPDSMGYDVAAIVEPTANTVHDVV
ncbi:MAG TPA: alcohol dehydrogenase catalytic domain-containing protein, partial [Armatimonadota bacterium]